MDPSESPFSNLDVWCDWNGDFNAPVEVTVSVEVWCTPNTQLPVLNTQSSSTVQIVEYGMHAKQAKTDGIKQLADDVDAAEDTQDNTIEEKAPVTPSAQRRTSLDSEYTDSLLDAETPSTLSNSGSVIVRSDLPEGSSSAGYHDPFCSGLGVDVTGCGLSNRALIPRKRSSESASLPDSVTDSERTYGGYKHKSKSSISENRTPSSSSGHSKKPSLIPRLINTPNHVRSEPTKVPLPPNWAPVLEDDFQRFEAGLALSVGKENLGNSPGCREPNSTEVSSLVTTKSALGPTAVSGANMGLLSLGRLSKLSTVVSRGSPCDISSLPSETGSPSSGFNIENSPPGGVATVRRSSGLLLPGPANSPHLILVNGVFFIRCPLDTEPAAYEASVTLLLHLQKGRPRDWWELVVPGLPRLSSNDHGYVYFRTPPDQGIEVRTTHFKRHTLVESCLMAQFLIPSKIVIPFRLCNAQFYGFLRDFKVTPAIHADVENDGESDVCLVKYHAVCSIDLIQRDFWAKECGFFLYIYGGPQGEFSCQLQQSQQKLHTIHLDTDPDAPMGVSEVQIICAPSDLAMFSVAWEVRLPRASAHSWMPRIKASLDSSNVEGNLQSDFEEAKTSDSCEVVHVGALGSKCSERPQRSTVRKKTAWWKTLLRFCYLLFKTMGALYVVHRYLMLYRCCEDAANSQYCVPAPQEEIELVEKIEEMPAQVNGSFTAQSEAQTTTETIVPTPLPLRDRIDYLLGWRGPMQAMA